MATGDFPLAARCCCNQHRTETFGGANDAAHSYVSAREAAEYFVDRHVRFSEPIVGAVTFSDPGMAEHVQRAVDDYMASLGEVKDDAATVVELIQRGDSWHISIRRGAMHYENAEPSLAAALEAVGRVLAESVGSCAEVPTVRHVLESTPAYVSPFRDGSCEVVTVGDWALAKARAELLAALPPVQITDPEALSKLTPARVRAYLKGKGWDALSVDGILEEWGWSYKRCELMAELSQRESRSAAAVYLDILQTEPGD